METSRMARETQILQVFTTCLSLRSDGKVTGILLQDEVDEIKARTRALQEEGTFAPPCVPLGVMRPFDPDIAGERKVRDKDRFIQVLWKALEVHGIAGPLAPAPGSGAEKVVEGIEEPWRYTSVCNFFKTLLRLPVQLICDCNCAWIFATSNPAALKERLLSLSSGNGGVLQRSDFVCAVPTA